MKTRTSWARTAIAIAICVPFVIPFLSLVSTATRESQDFKSAPGGLPHSFTLDHLIEAWTTADLGRALVSTLVMATIACVIATGGGLAAAFWLRLHDGRIAGMLRGLLMIGYAVPAVAWLIPVFVTLSTAGLTDNVAVAGAVYGISAIPFSIYLISTFYRQVLNEELLEACSLDGAGVLRTFWSIGVPLARPVIASVVALVFVWCFGDLLVPATLLQGDPANYPLTLATTTLTTREEVNLQGQAAAALVSLLPVLVVFAFAQKSLAAGFAEGSEK